MTKQWSVKMEWIQGKKKKKAAHTFIGKCNRKPHVLKLRKREQKHSPCAYYAHNTEKYEEFGF